MIIDRNYEGIEDGVSLYDLTTDPRETNDLRASEADRVASLIAELERIKRRSGRSQWPRATYEIDSGEKAALEALGYF